MPAGLEVTAPLPSPRLERVSATVAVNVAVQLLSPLIVTEPSAAQLPVQPVKAEPAAGVAVSVTRLPDGKEALQVAPHVRPAGEEVTVPDPVPALLTDKVLTSATLSTQPKSRRTGRTCPRPRRCRCSGR